MVDQKRRAQLPPYGAKGQLGCLALWGALALSCGDDEAWQPVAGPPTTPGPNEIWVQGADGTAYYIDRYEVTKQAYGEWVAINPVYGQPAECSENDDFTPTCRWPPDGDELHPVVCVDWCDAWSYCRARGQRLCGRIDGGANDYHTYKEADQWYHACSAGGANEYPYATAYDPHACNGGLHGRGKTAPVGSMPNCHTENSLFDMSGNIREWKDACETDPSNTQAFNYCRLGGGSFRDGELRHLTCDSPGQDAFRTGHWDSIGFRCCRDTADVNPAGGGGSGAGGAPVDGCNDCLASSCGTEDAACLGNESCILIVDCVGSCFTSECVAECEAAEPGGVDDFRALIGCFDDSCVALCD